MRGIMCEIVCILYPLSDNISAIIMAVVQVLTQANNHISMLLYLIQQIRKNI